MSTTLVDQLKLKHEPLTKPLPVQLAVSESCTVINYGTKVDFEYQDISEKCTFDIINLDSYNLILGMLFLFQHKVLMGFNPYQLAVRSKEAMPIEGNEVAHVSSRMVDLAEENLEKLWKELRECATDICEDAIETPLPLLRAINHTIPLIDESKIY
ncbi:hypothetical protein K439DRAFT_1615871 [Ramaria rubella]|nr:hypothetical protein K439DRAFT_1615871 [Ramaria rubella]